MATHQFISIIELRTGQEIKADGVDEHTCCAGFNDKIVWLRCLIQLEFVLEAAASASQHRDTQGNRSRLIRHDLRNPGGSAITEGECVFHAKEHRAGSGQIEEASVWVLSPTSHVTGTLRGPR
jgi:hypothetical protein